MKDVVPVELALPAASVAVAETKTEPFPRVVRSPEVRTTAWAEPVPVPVLVTVPPPERLNCTDQLAPFSAEMVTTPPAAVASAEVAPLETPVPRASVGAAGAAVSSVKDVVPVELALPAASVAVAETKTEPFPRVVRSPEVRTTAWAEPVPVPVLVTVPPPERLNCTDQLAPFSAEMVTTPPAAVASAEVAPLETPVPRASVGAAGAAVSTTMA